MFGIMFNNDYYKSLDCEKCQVKFMLIYVYLCECMTLGAMPVFNQLAITIIQ